MTLRVFWTVLCLGFLTIIVLQVLSPNVRPFGLPSSPIDLDKFPSEDVASFKLLHALKRDVYDIGIFGNSRVIGVRAEYVSDDRRSVFNFAVPGTSIRQSAVLIEDLARLDRLPRLSVVMIDNLALQYYSNPTYPGPVRRWRLAFDDILFGLQDKSIRWIDLIRMAKRHALIEWQSFSQTLNIHILKTRWIDWRFAASGSTHYAADGSRTQNHVSSPYVPQTIDVVTTNLIPAYFLRDIRRLATIAGPDRLLIVETPLAPDVKDPMPATTNEIRNQLRMACASLGLRCVEPPPVTRNDLVWEDATHPPPEWFGAWIASHISNAIDSSR